MIELTKRGVEWKWGPYQKEAFYQFKQKLCKVPILRCSDLKLPYIVIIDASRATIEVVLMQDQGKGL